MAAVPSTSAQRHTGHSLTLLLRLSRSHCACAAGLPCFLTSRLHMLERRRGTPADQALRGQQARGSGGKKAARGAATEAQGHNKQTMAERQIPARLQGGRGVRFLSAAVAEGEDERKRQGTRGRMGAFSGKGGCMGGRWARGVQRAARRDTGRQGGRGGRCWVSCREAGMHRPARIVHSKVGVGIKTWGRYGQAQGWH